MGIPYRATRGGMFGNTSFVSVVALETRGFVKGIRDIDKALEKHVRKAKTTFQKVSGIVSVGANTTVKALAGITATLGGIATAASMYGSKLERFMRTTSAIVSQTGGDMLEIERRLTDAAREMARTTDYSVTEIARSMTRLAQAGLNTEEIIQGTRSAIELAGITMGNLEFTTRLMAATFRQFGMKSMEDMARIADVFTVAITKSLLSLQDLEYAMKYAGPVAASLGWSIEEAAAAVAQFANLGLTGSLVGTHLRMSMGALLTVAGKTQSQIDQLGISSKKLVEAFKMSGVTISAQQRVLRRLGLTIQDVDPMLNNLGEILQKLADAGMTARDAYILFTRRAGGDIAKMVEDIKRTGRNAFNDFLEMLKHAGGRAHKIYTQTLDTVSGQWRIFVNIIKDVGLEVFYAYKDELKAFIMKLSEVGGIVRKALADPEVKAEIRRIFILATAWVSELIGKLATSKDALVEIITTLRTILKTVKFVFFSIRKFLHMLWTGVRGIKAWALNSIASIAEASGSLFNTIYDWLIKIKDFITTHFLQGSIYDTFKKVVEFVKHPKKTLFTAIFEQKVETGLGADPSKTLVGGLTHYRHPLGIKLIDLAKKLREKAELTTSLVEAATDKMAEEFYDLDNTIEHLGDKAGLTTRKSTNLITDEIVSTIKHIKGKVEKFKKDLEKENEEYANNFLNKQKKTSKETVSFWKDAWRALKSYTKTMFDTFRDLGESGGSFFDQLVSYMPEWKKIFVDTIDSIHTSFKNTLIGMMEGTKSFKDFWIDTWNLIKRKTIEIIAELMTQWVFNTFFGEIFDKLGLLETSGGGLFYKLFHPGEEEDKAKETAKEVATALTDKIFQGKLVSETGGGGILSGLGLGSVIDSVKKGVKNIKTFVGKLFGFG
ncbi:MAG: phage tail tape measure protein, partial [Thermoproteota archaeon]